ncbi:MAG: Transmembrane protein [uncultured bacterium]|nr:MAG: Transmembrane protein [uncultured bacterium]
MHFVQNPLYFLRLLKGAAALTDYLTEQEQIQQLKNWIKQYGLTILAGIVIALIAAAGWHYWQSYRNKILAHASLVYDEMLTSRAQHNTDAAHAQAQKLLVHYPRTPYAEMAAFMLAREASVKKNYLDAIQQLNWVLDHSSDHTIREIARVRLARLLLIQQKPDEALHVLKKLEDKNFIGLVDEIRGDAYAAENNQNAARNAYQLALVEIPNAEVTRPILRMKYDNLAVENNKISS